MQASLARAADAPGYPTVAGRPQTMAAFRAWLGRRAGVTADVGVIPSIGSKELVALLPTLLRLGPGDRVVVDQIIKIRPGATVVPTVIPLEQPAPAATARDGK